jgi:phospholipase D1/2
MPHRRVRRVIRRLRRADRLPGSRFSWGELAVVGGLISAIALAILGWERHVAWRLGQVPDMEQLSVWLTDYRRAWYALPVVAAAFTVLGLAMVPVLVMIAATGVAFGPWLGPPYAMVACLTSASAGFGLGRWIGLARVRSVGGERVLKVTRALERNGTLAVFFLRKVPAPFMLANILAGASGVRYRDFVLGTLLGMGAFVVALAGFGYQLRETVRDPSPSRCRSRSPGPSIGFFAREQVRRSIPLDSTRAAYRC